MMMATGVDDDSSWMKMTRDDAKESSGYVGVGHSCEVNVYCNCCCDCHAVPVDCELMANERVRIQQGRMNQSGQGQAQGVTRDDDGCPLLYVLYVTQQSAESVQVESITIQREWPWTSPVEVETQRQGGRTSETKQEQRDA